MAQMAVISACTYDINGSVVLKVNGDSELRNNSRRTSRSATLDGGVVVTDGGYCSGDRTLIVGYYDLSATDEAKLWNLFKNYNLLTLSNAEACFCGFIDNMNAKNGSGRLRFMVQEVISELQVGQPWNHG